MSSYVAMSGKVHFKTIDGPGIPGAIVTSNPVGSPNTAVTDSNGHYNMQVPANATLSVTADHVTCKWQNKTINTGASSIGVDFVLQPDV